MLNCTACTFGTLDKEVSKPNVGSDVLIVYGVIHPLIIGLGCFGNILTIIVLKRQDKWTSTVYLQRWLTWIDLLFLIIRAVYIFYKLGYLIMPQVIFGMSKIISSYGLVIIANVISRCGKMILVLIGLERMSAFRNPNFSRLWNKRRTLTMTIVFLSPVALFGIIQISEFIVVEQTSKVRLTISDTEAEMKRHLTSSSEIMERVRILARVLLDLLPLILVLFFNTKMIAHLQVRNANLRERNVSVFRTRHAQGMRITRMLIVTSLVFIILCLPLDISGFIIALDISSNNYSMYTQIPLLLNHAVNFIIYGLTNRAYFKHYIQILRCSSRDHHDNAGINRYRIIQHYNMKTSITLL